MKARVEGLSGFGRREIVAGYVLRPRTAEEVAEAFASGHRVALRGAGRSYGDAATHREGRVLDLSAMNRVLSFDGRHGIIEVEGGATIETLWRTGLPHGWWPSIVTGTMRPTLGGAIGMNVHGKNARKTGTLGEHVLEFDLVTPDGELRTLRPTDPEFDLVFGSAGTLGVVTRAVVQLRPVVSGLADVETFRARNWAEHFELFDRWVRYGPDGEPLTEDADRCEFVISSIDFFADGADAGRGLFSRAGHSRTPDSASLRAEAQLLGGGAARAHAWRVLRPLTKPGPMRFLNGARAQLSPVGMSHPTLAKFSFQLDAIPEWEKAYGVGGFVQYQSIVPKESAEKVFRRQGEMCREAGVPAYLGVLKIHRPDRFPLTYSDDGFSLALDLPTTAETWPVVQRLCWAMNNLVLEHGGRFYLAKDSTLRPEDARAYLGSGLQDLKALKARWDPQGLLTSDLAARLQLFD